VPLGVVYSIAIRLGLAVISFIVVLFLLITQLVNVESLRNFALQNHPRIDRLIDVGALRTNRAYYWLSLSLVSFVTAGLREELWRAATLAGMRALWPGAFMSRTGVSIAIVSIGVAFGGAHLPMGRFIRRNHFCAAATHRKQVPAAASLGGLRWRFLQP